MQVRSEASARVSLRSAFEGWFGFSPRSYLFCLRCRRRYRLPIARHLAANADLRHVQKVNA